MQIPFIEEEPHAHPHPHVSEDIDTWTCAECDKSISATRPPVLNTDNCSCAELGTGTDGLETRATRDTRTYAGDIFEYMPEQEKQLTYHVPPSSSNNSVRAPEGPERLDPNDFLPSTHGRATTFLSLSPEAGLNEKQHRRSSSFHETMPLTLQRFLDHSENPDFAERVLSRFPEGKYDDGFLKQDPFLRSSSSMKVQKGSDKTRRSQQSQSGEGSGISMHLSLSWGLDPVTGVGEWVSEEDENDVCMWMGEVGFEDEI